MFFHQKIQWKFPHVGREGRGRTQEYMGTGWHGLGWGGVCGGGVKNKFGLKCFLDDFKCYTAFFVCFFVDNRPIADPSPPTPFSGKFHQIIFFETLPQEQVKLDIKNEVPNLPGCTQSPPYGSYFGPITLYFCDELNIKLHALKMFVVHKTIQNSRK